MQDAKLPSVLFSKKKNHAIKKSSFQLFIPNAIFHIPVRSWNSNIMPDRPKWRQAFDKDVYFEATMTVDSLNLTSTYFLFRTVVRTWPRVRLLGSSRSSNIACGISSSFVNLDGVGLSSCLGSISMVTASSMPVRTAWYLRLPRGALTMWCGSGENILLSRKKLRRAAGPRLRSSSRPVRSLRL